MELGKKLQLKAGSTIRVINAPRRLGLELKTHARSPNVLVFVADRAALARIAPPVLAKSSDASLVWFAYPKRSGRIASDLNRDDGWGAVTELGWEGVRLIAIDETWSAMRFRPVNR